MTIRETNKKVARLKNFESSLINIKNLIRTVKSDYKKDIKRDDSIKTKSIYNDKLKRYLLNELANLKVMIENYE